MKKPKVNGEMSERSEHASAEQAEVLIETETPVYAEKQEGSNEESSSKMNDRHVMFETDNFKNCMLEAVWFGKKVPGKRRMFGRGLAGFKTDVSEFGDNQVTLSECKSILVRI